MASLGTDHHPFPRLVAWCDALAVTYPDHEVVIQYGYSKAPLIAVGYDFLHHAELLELMRNADVVISHGGPGTIMDAHRAGRRPIVVPRDPADDEHVDDHQLRFAEVLAGSNEADVVTTRDGFDKRIALLLAQPSGSCYRDTRDSGPVSGLANLVAELDRMPQKASRVAPMLRSVRRRILR